MPLVATAQIASSGHNAASDSRSSSKSVASSSAITALTAFPRSDFRPALTATSFADRVDCSIARRSLVYAYMPDWGLNPTNPSMGGLERSPAIVTLHHRARRQEPARHPPSSSLVDGGLVFVARRLEFVACRANRSESDSHVRELFANCALPVGTSTKSTKETQHETGNIDLEINNRI